MEIGTEISQKIRSAIKAKLIEQGAYVDDELPDYIMVMVANKKTQKQMTEDLSLFLGANTDKFTTWLHGLLKKLQSINTDDAGSKNKSKEKEKHKGEKRKHKQSQGDKDKSGKVTDGEKTRKLSTDGEKHRKLSTEGERQKKLASGGEGRKVEDKLEASTARVKPLQVTDEDPSDEIKISENTDEFNEENKEAEIKEQVKSSSTGKPPTTKATKSEKSSEVKKSSTRDSSKSKSAAVSKYVKSESKDQHRKPSSFVASVKRRYEEIEDEEYDPANPAVGSVASVVRGPQRKSSVPKSLQANKSLLMKAVTEAEKSVISSKKPESESKSSMRSDREPVELKKRLKTAAGIGLLSRSKRTELEALKYRTVDEPSKDSAKKPRRSNEGFENMKYTIRNETAPHSKSPPKKTSPKTKAPAEAPSRVAVSAFREMGHKSKMAVKKEEKESGSDSENEDNEGSDDNSSNIGKDVGDTSNDGSEGVDTDSDDEIEIEVTDRAAQTIVNMRDKNFRLSNKVDSVSKEIQTDKTDVESGESSSHKLDKVKMEQIDNSLLNMFIENLLPFEFIENEPFRMFAKTLEPKYHFPKRKKLMTEVGMLYNSIKDMIRAELLDCSSVTFSHSTWTSAEGEMYDTVKVHYVTKDWKLRSEVLKTSEVSSHNHCDSIAEHLDETVSKWNLPEPVLVTDDSELEHRVVKILGWKKIICFGSCIHTVVRRSLKERDISHFIEQGRKLITAVLDNTTVQEMLDRKEKMLMSDKIDSKSLVLDDKHDWRRTLEMLISLAEQAVVLHAAIMDAELINQGIDLRMMLYTFSQQSSVETLVKILNTFKTATEILTNSESPTIQKVIPIFIKLDKVLDGDSDDSSMIRNMKSDIRQEIKHFLEGSRETCLLACLLHPQTKQMAFVSQKEKEEIRSVLFYDVITQCETEYKDAHDDETKFRKGKKGSQRQTQAMSEAVERTDIRRVVVNKENEDNGARDTDDEHELDKDNEESVDNDIVEREGSDSNDEVGDGDRSKAGNRGEKMIVNEEAGPSVTEDGDGLAEGDSNKRHVRTPLSDTDSNAHITNLSITVENDWLDDVICATDDQRSPEETAKIEINLYMAEPASNKIPLTWWQEKELLYPHIANVARRVLAIPASSLNADDIFSLEKKKESKSMQIRPEHVDMMLFLKQNKALYETE